MRNEPAGAIAAASDLAGELEYLARTGSDPDTSFTAHMYVLARFRDIDRSMASALRTEAGLAADALNLPGTADVSGIRTRLSRAAVFVGAAGDHLHIAWLNTRQCMYRFEADGSPDDCRTLTVAKNTAGVADSLDDILSGTRHNQDTDELRLIAGHRQITLALSSGVGQFRDACRKLQAAVSSTSAVPGPEGRRLAAKAVDPVFDAVRCLGDAWTRIYDTHRALEEVLVIRRTLTGDAR